MSPEEKAKAARSLNERAARAEDKAGELRAQRDDLVLNLRTEDGWSYGKIATSVGLSRGMVALICRPARVR